MFLDNHIKGLTQTNLRTLELSQNFVTALS